MDHKNQPLYRPNRELFSKHEQSVEPGNAAYALPFSTGERMSLLQHSQIAGSLPQLQRTHRMCVRMHDREVTAEEVRRLLDWNEYGASEAMLRQARRRTFGGAVGAHEAADLRADAYVRGAADYSRGALDGRRFRAAQFASGVVRHTILDRVRRETLDADADGDERDGEFQRRSPATVALTHDIAGGDSVFEAVAQASTERAFLDVAERLLTRTGYVYVVGRVNGLPHQEAGAAAGLGSERSVNQAALWARACLGVAAAYLEDVPFAFGRGAETTAGRKLGRAVAELLAELPLSSPEGEAPSHARRITTVVQERCGA